MHQVASISLKGAELSAAAAPPFNTEQNAAIGSAKGSAKLMRRSKIHFLFPGWRSGRERAPAWKAFSPFFWAWIYFLVTFSLLLSGSHPHFKPSQTFLFPVSIRMRVKKLPMILALHLKRFKYMDQLHRYTKLSYRVVFPLELRLFNTSGDATNPDRMYDLVAVVVHCGR